jgi:Mycothiol maleylpyruvate isomerase N-terminal domain
MPVTRDEALAALRDGDRRVHRLVSKLNDGDLALRSALGGGDWSVADFLGHLASWEQRSLDAIECWRAGGTWQVLIGIRSVDDLNAENLRRWRRKGTDRTVADAAAVHDRLMSAIAGLTDRDWSSTIALSNGRRQRLSTNLGGTLGGPAGPFRHADAHIPDLRAFVSSR